MSLIFSRKCEYALQSVLYLALKREGQWTSIREMSKKLGIPSHFLGKILQSLSYKKILASRKGPSGGFTLRMPPENITLFHIVEAVDGLSFMENCVMGFPECSSKNPCPIHERWAKLRDGLYQMLVSKNIEHLAREIKKPEYRTPISGG